MAVARSPSPSSWITLWLALTTFFSLCPQTFAAATRWIQYTGNDGTVWLDDDRRPSLYTQSFGDCQGDSAINVTRFDAAYYKDNMTVLFHLGGSSALTNESLMLYIGVYAYGQQRFSLTFNPCNANILSLCPLNASLPIEANGIIPVAQSDVAGIPPIALTIPDFEGQAILRIFANSTQSQIACFSAVVTNGASFSHPTAVGSILGIFAAVALISSVAVAIYGQHIPETRKHYAHSVSVLVVFSVFQHIYFTGALSMNWPSVLVAFWSNYAWSAGMIYTEGMQNSINKFIGSNGGNISMVGSAPSGQNAVGLGGGYQISQIYRRAAAIPFETHEGIGSTLRPRELEHTLMRRDLVNSTSGFSWYGAPVRPGLPLPGNYSGFAGTLAEQDIPASNAFITGFLWLLVLICIVAISMILLKWAVEGLVAIKLAKTDRLGYFRQHWLGFTAVVVLRTCLIAFFMMMFLTMFQFTLGGAARVRAIAAIVFVLFFVGMLGIAAYALYYRLRFEKFVSSRDRLHIGRKNNGFLPGVSRKSQTDEKGEMSHLTASLPWWRLHFTDADSERPHVHDDEEYTRKFGWLASRFRRSKWWFFAFWLIYEFVRACFYGGAAGHPLTQVFGLLAWEIIALVTIVVNKPFESNRLNLLMVYLLGFSKVATVALSSAFDARFGLGRILTTVIGVIIIVIQGVLTICLMIAIVLGAISSYMSIMRNREDIKPQSWLKHRTRYFAHVDQKATDKPAPRPPTPSSMPETPKAPYFSVSTVRREPKIEDEDPDFDEAEENLEGGTSMHPERDLVSHTQHSRTQSIRSRASLANLPYGARRPRQSWSTRDFQDIMNDEEQIPSGMHSRMSLESMREASTRHRTMSMRGPPRNGTNSPGVANIIAPADSSIPLPKSRHRRSASNPLESKQGSFLVDRQDAELQVPRVRALEPTSNST